MENELLKDGFGRMTAYARRTALKDLVGEFVSVAQRQGYHISDIFQALSDYAQSQKERDSPEMQTTWDIVAALQESAAREAETKGRELP